MAQGNPSSNSSYATTGGKNPKQIHIAHRRSPSELTSLMIEQFTLQRQLEYVQAQQQQILSQQHQQQQHQPQYYSQGPGNNSHSRNGSINHKRSQSSANGHTRRHSLGLNEAKKAAAQVQAQRAGSNTTSTNSSGNSANSNNSANYSTNNEEEITMPPPSSFKFPSTVIEPPHTPSRYNNSLNANSSGSGGSGSGGNGRHERSRSAVQSPQRNFQFPLNSPSNHQQPDLLAPPGFNYHERRQSGHNRSNSRNDPNLQKNMNLNWRTQQRQSSPSRNQSFDNNNFLEPPQPNFTPGHRSRGSYSAGGSISSLNGFQLPGQQSNGRKSLFSPYLPQSSIPELVAEGRLVIGTLRVNKKNRSDAYVSTDGLLDADIFICGSKDRNRALEGDLVAIELLSVDEVWGSKREKEEKKRRKDNNSTPSESFNDDVHNDASTHSTSSSSGNGDEATSNNNNNNNSSSNNSGGLQRKGSLKQRPTMKKNDDVEVEGQSLLLVEEEEINDDYKPLYAGHVVAVIDRIPGQLFAGTLGLLRPSQQSKEQHMNSKPKIVWFKPTDKKVPLIAIPTEQAPKDFVENHENYANKVFVASIKRWPITSLHPFGTLISELGPINDPNIEIDAILRDNNFLCDEYLDENNQEKTEFELQKIDFEFEFSNRKDYSNEYVLAISEIEQNSDQALHVKRLSQDKIELGVHISDITEFIKEGSILDKKIRKRSSSVFLAQKTVHLLPNSINKLVSFNKNEKSLSLSVVFEIDTKKFEVDNVWIGESVIQPKVKLDLDQIDSILREGESKNKGEDDEEEIEISSAAKDYIKTISLISREFRRQRLENPKLTNDVNLTLLDQIDDEKVRLNLNLFKNNLSYSIINEIFLKVNSTVAQKTFSNLGDSAFLRRQIMPTLTKLETFKKKVTNLGIEIDTSDSSKLINSILSIPNEITRQCVELLFFKCLSRSKYFIAGKVDLENSSAFYFNLPLYTHFTSPLRRYGDFIVHRQLKSIIKHETNNEELPINISNEELESLKMTAEYCNFKKDCAKNSQDQSIHLLLSQTINELSKKSGQLIVFGTVLQVYESAFDVYLPEFGIEKRVHGDQLPLKKAEFDKKNGTLELYWEKGIDSGTYIPSDEREPLSYRNSIKNKFKTTTNEVVNIQREASIHSNDEILSTDLLSEFKRLKISPPSITIPSSENEIEEISGVKLKKSNINSYLKDLSLRVENDNYIQEVREMAQVPILLRAEIGMALPCLTVHAINPFTSVE